MLEHDLTLSQARANLDAIPMVFALTLDLAGYHHLHERINRMVLSAMLMTNADAGLFYMHKERHLELATMQVADSLTNLDKHGHLYHKMSVPLDDSFLVGASVCLGKIMLLKNVREHAAWVKALYAPVYEKISDIPPGSVLCIPLIDEYQKVLGVLQLINGKNSFFLDHEHSWQGMLQSAATQIVAQGIHAHNNLMRTLGVVQLHDRRETLGHVSRMGAMAAEIYQALHPNDHPDQLSKYRDYIRVAVMYHDLGKVAVSNDILQKNGPLDLREFIQMQSHTFKGAGLFAHEDSELARICVEVLLNHHEHWDGSGYPGNVEWNNGNNLFSGVGKRGEEIPQSARIAALVDVYDSLSSPDAGGEPWPEEEVLAYIRQGSGYRFDPQVVEAFFRVYETIVVIKKSYGA